MPSSSARSAWPGAVARLALVRSRHFSTRRGGRRRRAGARVGASCASGTCVDRVARIDPESVDVISLSLDPPTLVPLTLPLPASRRATPEHQRVRHHALPQLLALGRPRDDHCHVSVKLEPNRAAASCCTDRCGWVTCSRWRRRGAASSWLRRRAGGPHRAHRRDAGAGRAPRAFRDALAEGGRWLHRHPRRGPSPRRRRAPRRRSAGAHRVTSPTAHPNPRTYPGGLRRGRPSRRSSLRGARSPTRRRLLVRPGEVGARRHRRPHHVGVTASRIQHGSLGGGER